MLLITYDITDDKLRTKFAKYLSKFGFRLQYSVFEIHNSQRILDNIRAEINNKYTKHFTQEDSIMIFDIKDNCKKECYGYAKNEDKDYFIIT